ncbi:MAG: TrmH family RNA methyltransferase [Parcubacteria group bacterium]|jgi:tRNA G18 (ribose-2'-O)-methylase SpoU
MDKRLYVIIHNVRSAYNVGSIFRTADGAGVSKIFLTGFSPAPYDARKEAYPTTAQKMMAKTALGAEKTVSWERAKNISVVIEKLKKEKVKIIALEQAKNSVAINKYKPTFPCALILGNEVRGLDKDIIKKADVVLEIPMRGKKESLNVSVSAGIAMYQLMA